ncbi:MAG: hypothetical protein ACLUI3_08200 [Christensenellales bacterium]
MVGYIAHAAIEAILRSEQADLADAVFVHELTPGEGKQHCRLKDGAVILTNQNCYLLRAENGVTVAWRTPYEARRKGQRRGRQDDRRRSRGAAAARPRSPNLVMFTDNQDPVNLLALDEDRRGRGELPVLDDLPELSGCR